MKRKIVRLQDATPEQKKKIEKLQHDITKLEIKGINKMSDSQELSNIVNLMTEGNMYNENNDHHIERWEYGLSSPKQPDLKHDVTKFRKFVKELENTRKLSEEVFDRFDITSDAILEDVKFLANDKEAYLKLEYDFDLAPEFCEYYCYSDHTEEENINRFIKICSIYADIAEENTDLNLLYAKIVGHSLIVDSNTDSLYLVWSIKKESDN